MKMKRFQRLLAFVLVLCMVIPMLPKITLPVTAAGTTTEDPVIVIAGSDFQNKSGDTAGAAAVTKFLTSIKNNGGYSAVDGFLFAGDYSYGTTTTASVSALKGAINGVYAGLADSQNAVFVQGNHDAASMTTDGTLSASGARDAEDYGVYVINEKDYMRYNSDEETIKNTAAALQTYLDNKANYDKPIFVVSHLPLHYNMRTKNDGDGRYAHYIFDVLNNAGAKGLNIIFLFGHNHSNGWDDYLGGSAVYLAKGDSINIAQGEKDSFEVKTLNFTYMNAGYVGYYNQENTGAETDLTMTVFEIRGNEVTIFRYTESGLHDLKSKGVTNTLKNETGYDPNTRVYKSGQLAQPGGVLTDAGVTVAAPGVTALSVKKGNVSQLPDGYKAYQTFDITAKGFTRGNTALVTLPVDSSFDPGLPAVVIDHTMNRVIPVQIANGNVVFTTDHFSLYTVAQANVETVSATGILPTLKRVTDGVLKEGVAYVISDYAWNDAVLTTKVGDYSGSSKYKGFVLEGTPTPDSTKWYIKDGYIVHGSADSNEYLWIYYDSALFSGFSGYATLGAFDSNKCAKPLHMSDDDFNITSTNKYLLNRRGGGNNNVATAYQQSTTYAGSMWHFDEVVEEQEVVFSVTPVQNVVRAGGEIALVPSVQSGETILSDYSITWDTSDSSIATVSAGGVVTGYKAGQVYIRATLTAVDGVSTSAPITVQMLITVTNVSKTDTSITAATHIANQEIVQDIPEAGNVYLIKFLHYGSPYVSDNVMKPGDEGYNGHNNITGLQALDDAPLYGGVWYYDGTNVYSGTTKDTNKYMITDGTNVMIGTASQGTPFTVDKSSYELWPFMRAGTKQINLYGGEGYNVVGVYNASSYMCFMKVIPSREVALSVSPNRSTLHPEEVLALTPTVSVNGSTVGGNTIKWTSSDTSVATVDANGKVTAVSGGNVVITATLTAANGTDLGTTIAAEIPIQVVSVTTDNNVITASVVMSEQLERVTTLEQGVPYVITAKTSGWVLTGNVVTGNYNSVVGLGLTPYNDSSHVWYYNGTNLLYGQATGGTNYLTIDNTSNVLMGTYDEATACDSVFLNTDNKSFTIANTHLSSIYKYVNQYGGPQCTAAHGFSSTGSENNGSAWYFYSIGAKRTAALSVKPASSGVLVNHQLTLTPTITLNEEEQTKYTLKWSSSDTSIATVYKGKVTGLKNGNVTITATLTDINGEKLETPIHVDIQVEVYGIQSISISRKEGTIPQRASVNAKLDEKLTITYANGVTETVPVTVGMLTDGAGEPVDTSVAGTHAPLTVTYKGNRVCNDFTLNVSKLVFDDYPEYPKAGSVSVNKTGSGINFNSSGVAQIELSATGVPSKKGADVIIMLDTSSSMTNTVGTTTITRMQVLTESLNNLLTRLQANGADGQPMDIKVAVADFNGYYHDEDGDYYINPNDTTVNNSTRIYSNSDQIYTGTHSPTAGAFVDVHELGSNPFNCDGYTGETAKKYHLGWYYGTNYDYAFDTIYQMGEAIRDYNAEMGLDRDLFVVFMSDGAPFQYNYFSSQSNETGSSYWNDWLQGTFTDEMYATNANRTYYNNKGQHWMAEAIKGDRNIDYPVIRKNDERDTDGDNWIEVAGLGATMYSIGFCLAVDNKVTVDSMDAVIQNAASAPEYYFRADSAPELTDAFNMITNEIFYAATDAYYLDTMGQHFDLQIGDRQCLDGTTIKPVIEYRSYEIYTQQDVENGLCTVDQVGQRKTDTNGDYIYKLMEKVTFNATGTEAYSNVIGSGTNILKSGVICANTFWYNTTNQAKNITLADGTVFSLPAETFYWKLGTISTTELTLSYYVYLTGSLEGLRNAGVYDTNEYAELFYTNYLGNPCSKEVPTPKLPWNKASVGYGFYLVDKNGNPIVNQSTGQTGSFQNAVKITQPIYDEFLWNEGAQTLIASTLKNGVLPDGYVLFDNGAKYEVKLNSDGSGYYIIYTGSNGKQTTYVAGVTTNAVTGGSTSGDKTTTTDYTTANTVVWFGVVANIGCVPDTVVIDFGLPVDIHPLVNDIMMTTGNTVLAGIGINPTAPTSPTQQLAAGFVGLSELLTVPFGTAQITNNGEDNVGDAVVRYILGTMDMNKESTFSYASYYTGTVGTNGYYYSTITVIPATTIYYEDTFVDYHTYLYIADTWYMDDDANFRGTTAQELTNQWTPDGTALDKTQAEDRPGSFNFSSIDANNIYGFDGSYKNLTKHSMGAAMKFTATSAANSGKKTYTNANGVKLKNVDMNGTYTKVYGTAEFTFSGTGFDVISVTNSDTGFIVVQVFAVDKNGNVATTPTKVAMVDTYYGYEWKKIDTNNDGTPDTFAWVPATNASGALYQVPVIKIEGMTYGKYKAVITISHDDYLDHKDDGKHQYDFYLDAIRIYDPADDGAGNQTIQNAYKADGECWPDYFELRNMVITADTFDNLGETDEINGIVFIDGNGTLQDSNSSKVDPVTGKAYAVSDYANFGPNNELYLAPGQTIAFSLNVDTDINNDGVEDLAAIHLALKTVGGGMAKTKIHNPVNKNVPYSNLTTSTDLYYDITVLNGKNVMISNASDSSAIVSITNIKVTYKIAHEDVEGIVPEQPTQTGSIFKSSRNLVEQTLSALTYVESDDTETPVVPGEGELNPGTGDVSQLAMLTLMMLFAVTALAALMIFRRKIER